ncbi:MAG: deoxyguanosinetriphosphate triphosphohydrolase [Lachnospiraceae bacterium]|nr:deoxyguanosinetriphosphate triphosphohydrolase [Lachnospiraceae bacterium]
MNWNQLLCKDRIRSYQKSTTSRDLRTEFEKDYHRIIGSASFRRLQDKTQVFPLDKSDYIRTRLTHSLEVSSFAKSLAQNVGEKLIQEKKAEDFGQKEKEDISNILQCAGLLHDIGNPPFGHFGETTIQEWFKKNLPLLTYKGEKLSDYLDPQMIQDFYHFEGNAQALRVVTRLHFLVDENGMNLTKALLGTIIKYPVSSLEISKKSGNIKTKKMGYFKADKKNFDQIQEATGTLGNRHPLTYLLEAADDIAYKTADIEDSVEKGNISYDQLLKELEERCAKALLIKHPCMGEEELIEKAFESQYGKLIYILRHKYEKAIKKGYQKPESYAVQNWVVSIQGSLIFAASDSFIRHYDEIMEGIYPHDLFYGTDVEQLMEDLGKIAYKYSFTSKPIYKLEIAAETIFTFLLDKFVDAAIYYDTDIPLTAVQEKLIALISKDYRRIYELEAVNKSEKEKLYLRLLLVTDFICSMTDSFAKDLYQELNGIS